MVIFQNVIHLARVVNYNKAQLTYPIIAMFISIS